MRVRTLAAAALLLALLAAWAPEASAQCAMCRTALTHSAEGRRIGAQFNVAILMMVVAPYLVVGAVACVLFRRQIGLRLSRLARTVAPSRAR